MFIDALLTYVWCTVQVACALWAVLNPARENQALRSFDIDPKCVKELAWLLQSGTDAAIEAAAGVLGTFTLAEVEHNRKAILATQAVEMLVETVRTGGSAKSSNNEIPLQAKIALLAIVKPAGPTTGR